MITIKPDATPVLTLTVHPWRYVDRWYAQACATPSDIHEHLPVLRALAEGREVVEMGVRNVVSTWAFLAARPKALLSVDINYSPNVEMAEQCAEQADVPFQFLKTSTLEMPPVRCDLLFIDTLHTYTQLRAELLRHSGGVKDFIALHDTATFGDVGEDGAKPGLRQAVREWMCIGDGRSWEIIIDRLTNNGLMVLRRR